LEYGPIGFTPGSGTFVKTTSNPFILTGLTQGQSYQVYVFDSCAGGLTSTKFGPVQFSTFNCPNGCVYNLKLRDSFGDGWRSNPQGTLFHALEVLVNGTATPYTLPGATDTAASFLIPVCDNDVVELRFVNRGNWSNECGWIFRDATGTVVHTEATGGPNLTTGTKFTDTADCSNPCPLPVAAFTTTATGLSVNFSGTPSTGNNLTYAWDFGGGATGSGAAVTNVFGSIGAYTVTLVVTDGCGQKDTLTQTINVCTGGLGSVNHSANGLVVNFSGPTDPSQFTSINWNFGDGTTGSGASPSHTYSSGGTYSVIVTATDNCGSTYSQTLTVVICLKPTAYFTFRVLLSNGNGMTMEFDASATTDALQYQWLWGDGSSGTGGPIINHTYPVAQLGYSVRLIALSSCGTSDTVFHSLRELGDLDPEFNEAGSWFPNPIRSGASLSWLGTLGNEPMHIRLITADGRLIAEHPRYQGTWQVPVLAPGIYWLEWLEGDVRRRAPIAVLD
jgi:PKD repeat protein